LLPQLAGYRVIGVDLKAPVYSGPLHFTCLDLGRESSCDDLAQTLRREKPFAVVHLAFVIDPVRTGILDERRMWQINVAGTARVIEAVKEANRSGAGVRKLIYVSSVSAYGSDLAGPVKEGFPLGGHTLPYAIHKRESDEVVQTRAAEISECSTYILRPHIFAGASMQNYLIGALRGTPTGRGRLAAKLRNKGTRLPLFLPAG